MLELLSYSFMQKALLGGVGIAICCGLLGPFLVLKKMSLLGDGLAHFAFGGVALGFLLGINPLIAALIAAISGSFLIRALMKKNVYGDTAIALILSLGVGVGIVVIGITRGFTVSLYSYLIGSILALSWFDLGFIFALLVFIILFLSFFYKKMLFVTFNEELAQLSIKRISLPTILFTLLVAVTVVISIRAVGILLVSALIVIPTMIALSLSRSFLQTLTLSVIAAVITVLLGIVISFILDIPPSGSIVLLLLVGFLGATLCRRLK